MAAAGRRSISLISCSLFTSPPGSFARSTVPLICTKRPRKSSHGWEVKVLLATFYDIIIRVRTSEIQDCNQAQKYKYMHDNPSSETTFAVATLGCKVNQADSDAIGEQMNAAGFLQRDFSDHADIYIV